MSDEQPDEPHPQTAPEIRALAEWLFKIHGQVEGFVKMLEDDKFKGPLTIDGGDTMKVGLEYIVKWHARLVEAYGIDIIPPRFKRNGEKSPTPDEPPKRRGRPRKKTTE